MCRHQLVADQTDAERRAGWRPGGWQVSHFHSSKRRLYVLMHQGRDWTHKSSGIEVWEFDATTGARLQRVKLPERRSPSRYRRMRSALLYAIGDSYRIYGFRLATGKMLYRTRPLGFTPQLLTVWGE